MSNLTQYKTQVNSLEEMEGVVAFLTVRGHAPVNSIVSKHGLAEETRAKLTVRSEQLSAQIDQANLTNQFDWSAVPPSRFDRATVSSIFTGEDLAEFEFIRQQRMAQIEEYSRRSAANHALIAPLLNELTSVNDHLYEIIEWTFFSDLDYQSLTYLLQEHEEDIDDLLCYLKPAAEYDGEPDNEYYA